MTEHRFSGKKNPTPWNFQMTVVYGNFCILTCGFKKERRKTNKNKEGTVKVFW